MSRKLIGGIVLIGLGLLLVPAAVREQPDHVNWDPNRFYTAVDRDELLDAQERAHDLKRSIPSPAAQAQVRPAASETGGQEQTAEAAREAAIAAADSKAQTLEQKRVDAFTNQEMVSQTLKWLGILSLAAGAVLLLRASRANRLAQANSAEPPLEAPNQ